MRVGIIALIQESNTFISKQTDLALFQQELLVTGDDVRKAFAGTPHEVGGMLQALEENGVEAVPIFAARAMPFGTITTEASHAIVNQLLEELKKALPLDGLLVAPHGATVGVPFPDFDGHWLSKVREIVGPDMPIIGTLDPHGNLSPLMVDSCNALLAYRTNPHLDQKARGIDAGRMIVRTIKGEQNPQMVATFLPMAINIEKQCTSEEPCLSVMRLADEMQTDERVLSNSFMLGFPYADVEEMGSAVITVTDGDSRLAKELSDTLASFIWAKREEFLGQMIDIPTALAQAKAWLSSQEDTQSKCVCLLDMGDNVGGGSPGDATLLTLALMEAKEERALALLYDPASAEKAKNLGIGGQGEFTIGGKTDNLHGPPIACTAKVIGLFDGKFHEPQARHGGISHMDQGLTAVLKTDAGPTIIVNSRRTPPFSLRQVTSCGIRAEDFSYMVAKGVNAPIAAYREVCQKFIRVNTPGCTTADMETLPYHHRQKPLYPFERDCPFHVEKPIDHSQIKTLASEIVKRYKSEIDFNDERFSCIPIDVIESYWEMQTMMPVLAGLIDGTTRPARFRRASGQLISRHLWHLIGHLQDLEKALKAYDDDLDETPPASN